MKSVIFPFLTTQQLAVQVIDLGAPNGRVDDFLGVPKASTIDIRLVTGLMFCRMIVCKLRIQNHYDGLHGLV